MDHALKLTPQGLKVRTWEQNQGTYEFALLQPETAEQLRPFLWRPIQIDEDATLGDLFALLRVKNLSLLEFAIGEEIQPYLEEARQDNTSTATGLQYLEVYNEPFEVINGQKGVRGFEISRSFHGYGQWESQMLLEEGEESAKAAPFEGEDERGAVDIDFIPTHQLLEVPLRYNPHLRLIEKQEAEEGQIQTAQEFETQIPIHLIELLQAVFWEINLHGSPEKRDQTRKELNESLQRARHAIEGGGGETEGSGGDFSGLEPDELLEAFSGQGDQHPE